MPMNEPEDLFAVQSADQYKMDGNNNNRITGAPGTTGQFSFPASLAAGYAASGAAVGHDVSLAQILYYQNLLKQQANTNSKLQNRSPLPQYTVINNPSILPQVPGSPTNRSFAAALRNLAKQIGPGPSTSPERDNNLSDTDSRQPSPKARVSSSLLRNNSPTQNSSKTNDKGKILNPSSEARSGFQPYRPDENRTSLSAQSAAPSTPNPYGLDPTAAAAYSPYHAAAAAAAAAAAFYPPHLQHAYRLEEQLYLERCGVPMFSPSPYASPLYGMMPTALGLVSPVLHERLKLEEEQRQRESLERDRERSEREKREKNKKSPRASPSHSHLSDSSARKAPITVSPGLANHHTPPPPQPSPSLSSSSKHSQSSPTSANQLPASNSVPFMRPFEDNYTSSSSAASHSPSTKAKNSFLLSLPDSMSTQSTLAGSSYQNSMTATAAPSSSPFTPMPATKLANPFECFTAPKTPDGCLSPPTAHLASSQPSVSSFLSSGSNSVIGAGISSAAELTSFPPVTPNSVSSNSSFKPFASYPYDLIQYPAFKNHMMAPAVATASTLSPPLPKKARSAACNENTSSKETAVGRTSSSKGGRSSASGKSRTKSSKAAVIDKKLSSGSSSSSSTTSSSSSIICDLNSTPLNLSTSMNCESVAKQSPNGVEPIASTMAYDLKSDVGVNASVSGPKDGSSSAYSVVTEVN